MRWLMLICSCSVVAFTGCQSSPPQQESPGSTPETRPWTGVPVSVPEPSIAHTTEQKEKPESGDVNTEEVIRSEEEVTEIVLEDSQETAQSENEETEEVVDIEEDFVFDEEPANEAVEEPAAEEPGEHEESEAHVPALYGEQCTQPGPYPTIDWTPSTPEAEGMDSGALAEAANFAGQNQSSCMVVIRNGKLVGEWYWGLNSAESLQKSWSVTKSYSATVAGIAISRGEIGSVHDLVAEYVPEWDVEVKDWVTIEHLLSMTSGLKFGLIADNIGITIAKDMSKKAMNWPMKHTPGTLWEYNNHTVQMIEPVLRNATGMAPQDYAEEHLFAPLGMTAQWTEDKSGNATMYMNVKASCRDHAKFGYLYLRKGCWDGVQLIDEEYVHAATSSSSDMNPGYGYWWWLNGKMPTLDSIDFKPKADILHPELPHDSFCAVGLGSQVVEVIPSEDLVIVRLGPAPHENLSLWQTQGAVMNALMEDGKQLVHNGIVNRVMDALTD